MTAREMFEKLGFEQTENDDNFIEYQRDDGDQHAEITFSLKAKKFRAIYGRYEFGMTYHYVTSDELKAIIQQAKELGWLDEEKQEIKQETNFEYYKDEILECCLDSLAVVKGRPKLCYKTNCNDCDFKINQKECHEIAKDWLKQPYKKLTYKLNKFEFDLLNAHKDSGMQKCISNYRPLLELHEKGYFKDIDTSTPIHEILDNCEVV